MFQDFDPPAESAIGAERVKRLRAEFSRHDIAGFLVPRTDEHQSEYVAPSDERLAWLSGFTGSAGTAVILKSAAALAVDGRYTVQAPAQVDGSTFQILHLPQQPISDWLAGELKSGGVIGFDPRLHTVAQIENLAELLKPKAIKLKPLSANPVDRVWGKERPKPPAAPVQVQPERYAGKAAAEKLKDLQKALEKSREDAVVLTLPDSLCWLFNIRGSDVAHNPVVLAFAIVPASGKAELFIDPAKLGPEARAHLASVAKLHAPAEFAKRLRQLKAEKRRVRLDPATASTWCWRQLGGRAANISRAEDPCIRPKAVKNEAEIAGARAAHKRDGAAVCRFLAWFDGAATHGLDEIGAVEKLEAFRAATGALKDISFDTISGSGPNGAIVHYRVTKATNRKLKAGELFLLDSGGQYIDGTTDITRTLAVGKPTKEMRDRFTLVLKGHIAVATARFPKGTRGNELDGFARRALWHAGLDFDHGTGHGVGSYLSVHEGPQSIGKRLSVPLEPGMILSNEPGYYKTGSYGIRIENLELVTPLEKISGGDREVMGFETLTLVPIDRRLVVADMLTEYERQWLDRYHARVRKLIGPELDKAERAWLDAATEPLG